MALVDGGCLAINALKREGVRHVFALAGGHVEPYFQGCLDEGMRLIDTRHEAATVHLAEGWARATGQLGVAIITAGPGVTNSLTGLANAFWSASPVLVMGGRSSLADFDLGALQEMVPSPVVPFTKWHRTGYDVKRVPEYLSMAVRHALSGRPGPVYLEFPQDVLKGMADPEEVVFPTGYRTTARPAGEPAAIQRAVDLLVKAERPLVIAGSGIFWSQAGTELQELIETVRIPLFLMTKGRGCVPDDHPLCFGPTRIGTRDADVVLLVGTRLDYNLAYGRPPLFSPTARWIQVDIHAEEIGRNRPIEVGIVGDAKMVLAQMVEAALPSCRGRRDSPWVEACRHYLVGRREAIRGELTSDAVPIHSARLCQEVANFLDRDATVVVDGADIGDWAATVLRCYHPGHWLDVQPNGCLGSGISFAMAAQLAWPQSQVVVIHGDGSFGLNAMEFDTAVRHHIPFVSVIGNDGAWGQVKNLQLEKGPDRVIGTELGFTRYDLVVEALGGHGEYVEKPEDIRPALERAFASGKPACVNVRVDPEAASARRTKGRTATPKGKG
ncbi:MAG: hypothetical protein HYU86_11050 [Chloroflexi bacterium]|nr:hypothetical protein [Chloroflexota bacterium]